MGNVAYGNEMRVMVSYDGGMRVMSVSPNVAIGNETRVMATYDGGTQVMSVPPNVATGSELRVMMVGCFPKSEMVSVGQYTYVPISSLNIGDKILCWSPKENVRQQTIVTEIHRYIVTDLVKINNLLTVSFSHPIIVKERDSFRGSVFKWKVAYDIAVGDILVDSQGKAIPVTSKTNIRYDCGEEVLSLSLDSGLPFEVRNCLVRAENPADDIPFSSTKMTKLLAS